MLMPTEDRGAYRWAGRCPDCAGCIDDRCGGCDVRFCTGTYGWMQWADDVPEDQACNRCPNKINKDIIDNNGTHRTIKVRCNAATGHNSTCHWNPREAGRTPTP